MFSVLVGSRPEAVQKLTARDLGAAEPTPDGGVTVTLGAWVEQQFKTSKTITFGISKFLMTYIQKYLV